MHSETDVIIVGAGPVGMTLALLLAKRGRSVAVYERWGAPYPLPRAAAMSHETVRTYQSAGVLEDLRPQLDLELKEMTASYYAADGEVLMSMVFPGTGDSGYPPMVGFNQPDVDRSLCQACEAHPLVTIHRGWNASAIEQDDDRAVITFEPVEGDAPRAGDPITACSKFVVGCDGANSVVRSLMNMEVTDTGFSSNWLVIDILPNARFLAHSLFGHLLDPARPATLAPAGKARQRFEFMVVEGDDLERLAAEDSVWELIKPWNVTAENAEIGRRAIYTFRGRWAESWREGRVLLAGDAAHQMPPFMGQGFNSGVRDAIALAWRIDMILAGKADADLLDSYTTERLYHVKQIVETSVFVGRMICITDAEAAKERDAQLRMMRDSGMAPPQPDWRLGPGCFMPDDPAAGFLSRQAPVEKDGKAGLLDDLVGAGRFVLIGNGIDPVAGLSDHARTVWTTLDGLSVTIGEGAYRDVTGAYSEWFEQLGANIVLTRPDFQIYGAHKSADFATAMVETLGKQLQNGEMNLN